MYSGARPHSVAMARMTSRWAADAVPQLEPNVNERHLIALFRQLLA